MFKRWGTVGVVLALVMFMAVPASAGKKGTDRPFKGTAVGEVTFEFGPCPEGPQVTTHAWGKATHMGRVEATWVQCAVGDSGGFVGQVGTLVAANGDEVFLKADNPTGLSTYEAAIVGGTGRFEGASGLLDLSFVVEPQLFPIPPCDPTQDPFGCLNPTVPWPWSGSIDGLISY
ncbi:MAG: hypothetical protein HKN80_04155 [Acidimicrobiia bacterium]|nr:hypothetical protein [Acidimicrobiia bacterium]